MHRVVSLAVVGLLGLSSPVFAQSTGQPAQNQYAPQANVNGQSALAQDGTPQTLDTTALLIGGGVLIGGGALVAVVVNNNRNDNNNSPVSP